MSGSSLAAGAHCPLCPLPIAHYPLLPGAPGGGGGGLSESGLGILVGEGGYGRALVGEDRGSVEKWTPLGNKAGVHMDIALRSYCASTWRMHILHKKLCLRVPSRSTLVGERGIGPSLPSPVGRL